jgi:dephospho-CoA kinase
MSLYIGLTGPNASGKGEVARILAEWGFTLHSLSDVVREEATRRGLDHSRESLILTGTSLRQMHGEGALAERILPLLTSRSVIDSIRNPAEILVLRSLPGFHLLGVDAPEALRYQRSRTRGRAGDGDTLEEFQRKERLEKSDRGPGQQLGVCFSMADVVVNNDGTLQDLRRRVEQALASRGVLLPPG